ncbi:MAG: alpha/beta hydrolase [Verrucomicrobiota bacterium JB022]|nr:alpha/beta hydrolase [Verrucomicrobiota bacterium JB022]
MSSLPADVYIVPGYGATPRSHWFPWLRRRLAADGLQAQVVALPAPTNPQPAPWQQALARAVGQPGPTTSIVAHSLGCLTLLHYLQSRPAVKVGAVVLVAGFYEVLDRYPNLQPFFEPALDFGQLRGQAQAYRVIASRDDTHVPLERTQALAQALHAPLKETNRCGHFLAEDGVSRLPLALDLLRGNRPPKPTP